ncbi:uncharacterized protein LOC113344203 [Papaver somniferum]|uniref:uncharacterized protein LOC113344203 n=1 Tax=Papaver somniferum TaxID=3469 RepID=UPI000E6FA196|nr:uncharacterized protein LOC113344203 [Papaver somniferum]
MHHNLTIQKTNFSFIVAKFDSSNLRNVICSVSYDPPSLSSNEFHLYGVEIDSPGSLDFVIQFMDSCNGLVWFWSDQREFFGLWNPNNNEYKELPKSPNKPVDQNTFAYAFGYDCDYKLICLYDNDDDGSLVDVYTMGPNSWKNSTQVVLYEISIDGESAVEAGVLANGFFHWLGMMEDYGVQESLTRHYTIIPGMDRKYCGLQPTWIFSSGEILFANCGPYLTDLLLYDPKDGSAREPNMQRAKY